MKIVRAGFGRDFRTLRLRLTDQIQRFSSRNMAKMELTARQVRKLNVARHLHSLRLHRDPRKAEFRRNKPLMHTAAAEKRLVLTVCEDREAKLFCVGKRAAQDVRVRDRLAVVGERYRAAFFKLSKLREFFPFLPQGHSAHGP